MSTHRSDLATQNGSGGWPIAIGFVYIVALVIAIATTTYDFWGGLIVLGAVTVITIPMLRSAGRRDGDSRVATALILLFFAKLVIGTSVRYYVVVNVLGGDALGYDIAGEELSHAIGASDFGGEAFTKYVPKLYGTPFIRLVTGGLYTIVGVTRFGGFIFFSWLAFLGLFLFQRAVHRALPGAGLGYIYLLCLPTLLFWPSSIGKESWMIFTIGIAAYGAAGVITRARGGFVALGIGLLGTAMIRPHVTIIVLIAAIAALFARRTDRGLVSDTTSKVVGLVVLSGVASLVFGRAQAFFGLSDLSGDTLLELLDETTRRSTQGGSAFTPARVDSPVDYPWAVVTVLFRPFPFEVHSFESAVSAAETLLLSSLFIWRWKRVLAGFRSFLRHQYLVFVFVFVAIFVYAFSAIGNFGILARQRTQLLPLFVVLAVVPTSNSDKTDEREEDGEAANGSSRSAERGEIEQRHRETLTLVAHTVNTSESSRAEEYDVESVRTAMRVLLESMSEAESTGSLSESSHRHVWVAAPAGPLAVEVTTSAVDEVSRSRWLERVGRSSLDPVLQVALTSMQHQVSEDTMHRLVTQLGVAVQPDSIGELADTVNVCLRHQLDLSYCMTPETITNRRL